MTYTCSRPYSTVKRNEVLKHVATWMNLENITVVKTQRDGYCTILLKDMSKIGSFMEIERLQASRFWEERQSRSYYLMVQFPFGEMKMFTSR